MVSARKDRALSAYNRRATNKRPTKRLFYIFVEGQTEEKYFNYLKSREGLNLDTAKNEFKIHVVRHGGHFSGTVDDACEKKQELDKDNKSLEENEKDIVWAVFDTENPRKNNNARSLKIAIEKAKRYKIEMSITEPCIEYWFFLHYKDEDPAFHECDDALRLLKIEKPKYEKNMPTIGHYAKYFPLAKAREAYIRARRIYERVPDEKKHDQTCTDIYKLVEILFGMSEFPLEIE